MVLYTVSERIAYITLNNPEKRNALDAEMVSTLRCTFKEAEADPNVKVIILNANGKVFSSGADMAYIQSLQNKTLEENLADSQNLMFLFESIYSLSKVVIAQIEGAAVAAGCGLATVCDVSFAVPEAVFGYTEVRIGFVPAIVSVFLLRKVGEARAKELLLSGKLVSAEIACQLGLINFVEDSHSIKDTVRRYALNICNDASTESLRLTKMLIAQTQSMHIADALLTAARTNAQARTSDDFKRGITAFLNNEKVNW